MKKEIKNFIVKKKKVLDVEVLIFGLSGIILAILLSMRNHTIKENTFSQNQSDFSSMVLDSTDNSKNSVVEQEITIYREDGRIITLPLEKYLIGVVGAEMPASFPIEALKAQAIVSRTYALKKIQEGKRLTDTVSTQSYKDDNELRSSWGSSYSKYYQNVKEAVECTRGLVLYYQEDLIDAVYHSTSNGKTEDAIYVWGSEIPYLKSVDSNWDINDSSYFKKMIKEYSVVLELLGVQNGQISIQILSRDISGRVLEVRVGNQIFSGVEIRNRLGLRSTDFDFTKENGNLVITTRGYGHGVGMSQYGASEMAKEGYHYDQILKHYYSGVSIQES